MHCSRFKLVGSVTFCLIKYERCRANPDGFVCYVDLLFNKKVFMLCLIQKQKIKNTLSH